MQRKVNKPQLNSADFPVVAMAITGLLMLSWGVWTGYLKQRVPPQKNVVAKRPIPDPGEWEVVPARKAN